MQIRRAKEADLPAIIALFGADELNRSRPGFEPALTPGALEAFREIEPDPNNELWVADLEGVVIGSFQLTFIPGLTRGGMRRALVEAVFVHPAHRKQRVGEAMMNHALARARERGCRMMQLTSDLRRTDAHRFYARLGFEASHVGMKKLL